MIGIAGQCLDATDGRDTDGAAVQIFGCSDSRAQVWTVQNGTLQAVGRCLTAIGSGPGSGLAVQACDGGRAQHWQFSSGAIVNPDSTLCLDVQGDATADGTPVISANCADDPAQVWKLS